MKDNDLSDVGQDKTSKDVIEKYDREAGKYNDKVADVSPEEKLPTTQLPKGKDPSPFVIGPMGGK